MRHRGLLAQARAPPLLPFRESPLRLSLSLSPSIFSFSSSSSRGISGAVVAAKQNSLIDCGKWAGQNHATQKALRSRVSVSIELEWELHQRF